MTNPIRSMLLLAVWGSLMAFPAIAKEKPEWRSWPTGERLYATVGYYKPTLNTKAAVSDSDGNISGLISFEDTLGLSSSKGTVIGAVGWRISKRNSLSANYFKLDRSASQDSTIDIFIDTDPPVEQEVTLPLSSAFNIESVDITYAFRPVVTRKHNLGIGLGLALQRVELGFKPSANCALAICSQVEPREVKSVAPLPTLKLLYNYAITPKWIVGADVGYFALDLELDSNESIGGSVWNVGGHLRWKTWKNAGFSLTYKFFDVDLDYEKRQLIAVAEYDYRGFVFGFDAYY